MQRQSSKKLQRRQNKWKRFYSQQQRQCVLKRALIPVLCFFVGPCRGAGGAASARRDRLSTIRGLHSSRFSINTLHISSLLSVILIKPVETLLASRGPEPLYFCRPLRGDMRTGWHVGGG